jgi:hypothetical protein
VAGRPISHDETIEILINVRRLAEVLLDLEEDPKLNTGQNASSGGLRRQATAARHTLLAPQQVLRHLALVVEHGLLACPLQCRHQRSFQPQRSKGAAEHRCLPGQHLDAVMDFEGLAKYGSRMGTGTMIILDDRTCVVGMCHNLMKFFAQESCGWCTPCRDGLPWVRDLLWALEIGRGQAGDLDLLEMHTRQLGPGLTYCALAPGAVEPLTGALRHFRGDFQRHIDEKGCPWRK